MHKWWVGQGEGGGEGGRELAGWLIDWRGCPLCCFLDSMQALSDAMKCGST